MQTLTLQQDSEWITFNASNASFISRVKFITPTEMRRYDTKSRKWFVHHTKGAELVGLATKFYRVDWSNLPGPWQMLIVGGRTSRTEEPVATVKLHSPYATLYLLDTAPPVVVKAVYQALLSKYHPDHNEGVGDLDRLRDVIEAYRKITG